MTFRDDRDALVARIESLEASVADAEKRVAQARAEVEALKQSDQGRRVAALEAQVSGARAAAKVLLSLFLLALGAVGYLALAPRAPEGTEPSPSSRSAALLVRIDGAPFDHVVRRASGAARPLHNFPALIHDRGEDTLWVIGRGVDQRFPAAQLEEALDAYRGLLLQRGYAPDGARAGPDGNLGDILADMNVEERDDAPFTAAQVEALETLTPAEVWGRLSGAGGGPSDRLIMYAHLDGLSVQRAGLDRTFSMESARRAFALFEDELARRRP